MGGRRSREHRCISCSSRWECAVGTVRLRLASMALPLLCLLLIGGADAAFTASSLAFAPAQVGVGSEMSVSFVSDAAFSSSAVVSIVLPSFGEGRSSFSPTVVTEQPFRTASWNAGTETLSFTASGLIAANTVRPDTNFLALLECSWDRKNLFRRRESLLNL